jgi:hypothetical protein
VFDTHIGDETEHTAIGDVELVILVSAPLADVVHKCKFIELIFRALLDSDMHTSAQPIIISNDSIGFQMDNLTTSFIAQNVPTSRSALE